MNVPPDVFHHIEVLLLRKEKERNISGFRI